MINESAVAHIKKYGTCRGTAEEKLRILQGEMGFRVGERAQYVLITGCYHHDGMPQVLKALKSLLDALDIDCTLLEKEYCCGWMPLGQPAVMAKNEEGIARAKELSREFIRENFKQAEALGARSIVLFCAACEPSYANWKGDTGLEVISFSELLDRHYNGGKLDAEIDYYAGCYRFRRRITSQSVDISAALRVLGKVNGLEVNQVDSSLCCYVPAHLEQLVANLKASTLVTICSGCYYNLLRRLQEKPQIQVKMLPEIVWDSLQK